MYCLESNTQLTFLTNIMQETLAGYSYTLVRKGWIKLIYGGNELMLQEGDLLIYSPSILKTTHLPLSVIAERLHFSDQSSFGRFFLRMRGISPKQYRAVSA